MSQPILGYRNFLARETTVLTASQLATGASVEHLRNPNMTAVTNFGVGPTVQLTVDFVSDLAPTLLFIRYRGTGWLDLVDVGLEISANSDLSAPDLDATITEQFPATWPVEIPVRPVTVDAFTAVTARRYARITWTRTAGDDDLEIAYVYLGASQELTGTAGYRAYGSSIEVEDHSETVLSGLQSDLQVTGSKRRSTQIRLEATGHAQALDEWIPYFMYGASSELIAYVQDGDETDDARIQWYNLLGTVNVGQRLAVTAEHYEWWTQTFTLKERL